MPGLCAGGYVDPRNVTPGYLALIRTERCAEDGQTAERKNFDWYRENVLLPFVNCCRGSIMDTKK